MICQEEDKNELKERLLCFQKDLLLLQHRRYEVLDDDCFVDELSKYLLKLILHDEKDIIQRIIREIGVGGIRSDQKMIRERSLCLLIELLTALKKGEQSNILLPLVRQIRGWLILETEFHHGYRNFLVFLNFLIVKCLENRLCREAGALLVVMFHIRNGKSKKNIPIQQAVLNSCEKFSVPLLVSLLVELIAEEAGPDKHEARELYRCFDKKTRIQLLKQMFYSDHKRTRLALLEVFQVDIEPIVPELLRTLEPQFQEVVPWYVVRNSLNLLSGQTLKEHERIIKEFLSYPDIRVKKEAVACLSVP